MAKSQAAYTKVDKERKKAQKKKEKEQRKEERKANAKDGKSLEEMMAYVDEYGNISSTPPDPDKKRTVVKQDDIVIGARNQGDNTRANTMRRGRVTFFNTSKGYGFIKDEDSQESIFVHMNSLTTPVKENDKVTFETERGPKGYSAVRVKKI
jgi:cold shock CspA family protein